MHACLLFIRFSKSFANVANTFGNQIIGFLVSMLGSVVQSGRIGFNQISENEEIESNHTFLHSIGFFFTISWCKKNNSKNN